MASDPMIDWDAVLKTVGSTAAVVGILGWLARVFIKGFFEHSLRLNLEEAKAGIKHQYDQELAQLRGAQEKALAAMQAKANERLEQLRSTLARVERLEEGLIASRGESYGAIWSHTGALNLFGPPAKIDKEDLSEKLKDWYFEHGWVLSESSVPYYFLAQEALSFSILKSLSFKRPSGQTLYASDLRTTRKLRTIREKALGVLPKEDRETYSFEEIEQAVNRWKQEAEKANDLDADERAWVMFQFVLSALRSRIVKDLKSRQGLRLEIRQAQRQEASVVNTLTNS